MSDHLKMAFVFQVLGPFHQSLTAIVGPNGSGKSNVVDALMFVFGYRAQKIRSKRVSALIHNLDPDQNIRQVDQRHWATLVLGSTCMGY